MFIAVHRQPVESGFFNSFLKGSSLWNILFTLDACNSKTEKDIRKNAAQVFTSSVGTGF